MSVVDDALYKLAVSQRNEAWSVIGSLCEELGLSGAEEDADILSHARSMVRDLAQFRRDRDSMARELDAIHARLDAAGVPVPSEGEVGPDGPLPTRVARLIAQRDAARGVK